MKSGFDFKEYERWVKKLGIAQKEFTDWLREFMLKQGNRVINLTKLRQRTYTYVTADGKNKIGLIDTGTMLRSWAISDIQVDGDNIFVEVHNPVEYASWIEYGHHLKGKHPFGGAYLLTVSINEVQKKLPARFNKEFLKWLKSKGVE